MFHDIQLCGILLDEGRCPTFYNAERRDRMQERRLQVCASRLLWRFLHVEDCPAGFAGCDRRVFGSASFLESPRGAPCRREPAPDFTLASQEGSSVSLKDYRGHWVVLYFYPKDQTPGCTREAHNFQVDQSKYDARNAVVLGVSVDSVDSHKKFCTKEGLNFKLLADGDGKVSREYGSLTNLGVVKFAARHTFLIDPSGKIARTYIDVDPTRHS